MLTIDPWKAKNGGQLSMVQTLTRRRLLRRLAGTGAAAAGLHGSARGQQRTIRIGVTVDLSGPEKANGAAMHQGSVAYFNAVNRRGGLNGAKIELLSADDTFDVELAKRNALAFRADPTVLALLHPIGTRQTSALMDSFQDLPIVGPFTGTAALRKKPSPNTFWVRASYDVEVERLVATAVTLGINRVALVHPADPFGAAVLAGFNAACDKHSIKPAAIATTPATTSIDVEPAAKVLAAAAPQVIVMGLGSAASSHFVRAQRRAGYGGNIFGLSVSMSAQSIHDMGEFAAGVGFSIVVPSPFAAKFDIVRRYQADMLSSGFKQFSLPSLETYIDAAVLAEGLRRAGASATRVSLISALEEMADFDVGGLRVRYSRISHEGSRFADVAMLDKHGNFRV